MGFCSVNRELELVLASASPRRRELLSQIGLQFSVNPARVDEAIHADESPIDAVRRLALLKASAIADLEKSSWVIGADTVVCIDGQVLGKPESRDEAIGMLRLLSGRTHSVLGGFALLCRDGAIAEAETCATEVTFARLTDGEIGVYVETGEPMDKAGAYAIQGIGGAFVSRIEGSYSNVVGLPLVEMISMLRRHAVISTN